MLPDPSAFMGTYPDFQVQNALDEWFGPVNRPIGAHFHSGGRKFSYLGEDLDEAFREPEKLIASTTV